MEFTLRWEKSRRPSLHIILASRCGGRWPMWPITHVNQHVLKRSRRLAGWNYIQYDWRSHDGTLFTYWPESAALCV